MGRSLTDADRRSIRALLTHRPPQGKKKDRRTQIANWPFKSESFGVHPDQIPEAREHYRRHGLAVDFTKDGAAIMTGPNQHRQMAKADGIWNGRDGFSVPGGTGREPHQRMVQEIMKMAGD